MSKDTDKLPLPSVLVDDINSTKVTVTIKADKDFAATVTKRLEPYKHLPRTFRPALEEVGNYVRGTMITRTFDQEGPGWKPLRPRTIMERLSQGYPGAHPILKRSGDLYKELTRKSHPQHVEIIKTGKHARIEIGGSSKKFLENQMGVRAQRLPARPMVPGTGGLAVDTRDRVAIRDIIVRSIAKQRRYK